MKRVVNQKPILSTNTKRINEWRRENIRLFVDHSLTTLRPTVNHRAKQTKPASQAERLSPVGALLFQRGGSPPRLAIPNITPF